MTYASMWAYPWDLLDDGLEDVLSRLREEIGLDAVSVAASYHSVTQLRLHTRSPRRLFSTNEGAVYFQPDADLWRGAPIQPNAQPLNGSDNPLETIGAAAERIGIKTVAWTVCLHNSHLGRTYPEAAQRNVFGDIYPHHLCPSNENARLYVKTMAQDLSRNYPLFAVEAESLSFGGFAHFHAHEKIGMRLGALGNFLLSLCFCDSCRRRAQEAGIDVDGLADRTRRMLLDIFEKGAPSPFDGAASARDLVREDPDLASFLKMRQDVVASLHEEVKQAAGDTFLIAMNMGDPLTAGFDGKRCAEAADALELLCYTAEPEKLEQQVAHASGSFCGADDLIVGLSAYAPHSPSRGVLERNLERGLELGVRAFAFYNYGIMPASHLDWVRGCVEILRRAE